METVNGLKTDVQILPNLTCLIHLQPVPKLLRQPINAHRNHFRIQTVMLKIINIPRFFA